jgi:SAM-dependent methyltransferase
MKVETILIESDDKYTKKFGKDRNYKSLGWGSENSQIIRFDILKQINDFKENDSVLDVGCGHGDFCKYFTNYKGIDIRDSVVEIAKSKYSNYEFETKTIFEENGQFDWIFGSGIFGFNRPDWNENVLENLNEMIKKSNKGIGVNFLSSLTNGSRDPEMKYTSPSEITEIVSKLGKRFILRHDYRPNDMTIYIFI